jgi:Sulfotransferase family
MYMNSKYSQFTAKYFIDKAIQFTGLSDFGEKEFMPSYEKLVYSLREEAALSAQGWQVMESRLVRLLANRLRFEADLKKHPEILEQELLPALVIVGLPRTGSTKLQRMVAASKTFQELIMWQAYNPAPWPGSDNTDDDVRIADAENFCHWRATNSPGTNAAHHVAARQIEEETYLLEFAFDSVFPNSSAYIPTYSDFLKTVDKAPMYRYLRKLLQYIQWQFHRDDLKPWILKAPHNLGNEEHILKEIPGSKFLVSHRDPNTLIASTAAILKANFVLYSDHMDKKHMGRWVLDEFSSEMAQHMKWREANPDVPLLNLAYRDIEANGLDVAKKVHAFLQLPFSSEAEQSVKNWLEENVQHMHGKHEYSLEEYGLTQDGIQSGFGAYMEKYSAYL